MSNAFHTPDNDPRGRLNCGQPPAPPLKSAVIKIRIPVEVICECEAGVRGEKLVGLNVRSAEADLPDWRIKLDIFESASQYAHFKDVLRSDHADEIVRLVQEQ